MFNIEELTENSCVYTRMDRAFKEHTDEKDNSNKLGHTPNKQINTVHCHIKEAECLEA